MSYIKTLDKNQIERLEHLIKRLRIKGITNDYSIAGALCVVSKECEFKPKSESSYANTSNARIRKIFGKRVPANDVELNALKKNDEKFFNAVYGGRYGNAANEGYKFRGRGMNQLTFKDNYSTIKLQIGHDIISNPDLVNDTYVGADVMIQYFKNRFRAAKIDINGFADLDSAVLNFYRANAGFGKSLAEILKDTTGGLKKANSRSDELYEYVKEF